MHLTDKMRYVFFYSSSNIGGAQLLFARLAKMLIKDNFEVLIIGYSDNFINSFLKEYNLEFHFHELSTNSNRKVILKPNDILILSASYLFLFEKFIEPNKFSRIVFWELHPNAIIESTAFSLIHKKSKNKLLRNILLKVENNIVKRVKSFLELASVKNSFYFMCRGNFELNKQFFNFNLHPNFLPIPINTDNVKPKFVKDIGHRIKIIWISRLDKEKLKILKLLIDDILIYNNASEKLKIELHVVGANNKERDILIKLNPNIQKYLINVGVIYNEDLHKYINDNIDIGFSMGTSSLEIAKSNTPSVLVSSILSLNYYNSNKERYLWLFNSEGFDLSLKRNSINHGETFSDIIKSLIKNKMDLAEKSYNYSLLNHSMNQVYLRFKVLTLKSDLRYENFKQTGIFKNNLFQKILFFLKLRLKQL